MATVLSTQLAAIRAKSTNSLDLKVQKKAHSQSLLFDPRVAATQDFNSLFLICLEGFQELCQIDSRFTSFRRTIFSEQSSREDRTQLTEAQNKELGIILESFLWLVGARLQLKPALKAVEWLIRRFRVHEHQTETLLITFLPYHSSPVFPILLSILPEQIPITMRFIYPYIQSRTCPPRHIVIYTATNNLPFFAAFNNYVLKVCRNGYHYSTLLSLWASVVTEAIFAMLDQARASAQAKIQHEENVLLAIVPTLNEGLSLDIPELKFGCYTILIVLASKGNLNDNVLTAMMEAVAISWTPDTNHEALFCLVTLAQRKEDISLPPSVWGLFMKLTDLDTILIALSEQYDIGKLSLGIVRSVIDQLKITGKVDHLIVVRKLIEAGTMDNDSSTKAIEMLLLAAHSMTELDVQVADLLDHVTDLLLRLADSDSVGELVQRIFRDNELLTTQVEKSLQILLRRDVLPLPDPDTDVVMEDPHENSAAETFASVADRIPTRTAYEISFLSYSPSHVFTSLEHAFLLASASPQTVQAFSDLPVLRKSLAMTEPLFFSFYIRTWCGQLPATARVMAIKTVSGYVKSEPSSSDVQMLLPYVLYALSDPAETVRIAAADLVIALDTVCAQLFDQAKKAFNRPILGKDRLYGQGKESKDVTWLSADQVRKFLENVLLPCVEETILDADQISRHLSRALSGGKQTHPKKEEPSRLKRALREAIYVNICSHLLNTPLFSVKLRLLQMLKSVERVGSTSRTKALLPLLSECSTRGQQELQDICDRESINLQTFVDEVAQIVSPSAREGLDELKKLIEPTYSPKSALLDSAIFLRLRSIWKRMKPDLQSEFATSLFELAAGNSHELSEIRQSQALDTLRALPLSTEILSSLMENVPALSTELLIEKSASNSRTKQENKVPMSKTPETHHPSGNLESLTLVLEIVQTSKVQAHPGLFNNLFAILADLQHIRYQFASGLTYLRLLALENLLTISEAFKATNGIQLDHSTVRAQVVVECMKTTPSPQLHQTALLLLSSLASIAPEIILHSVMPILTFMGSSIIRQDDDYSAYVTRQTLESIVPCLVESFRKNNSDPIASISELLLSFVAAYKHVPENRRIELYSSLMDKLGTEDFLFALLVLLVDKHPGNKPVTRFATDISSRCSLEIQLQTLVKYVDIVIDVLKPEPTISMHLLRLEGNRNAQSVVLNLLPLAAQLLDNARQNPQVSKLDDGLRLHVAQLVDRVFLLSDHVKSYRKLNTLCGRVLASLLSLLSTREFIAAIQALLERPDAEIQSQLLEAFEQTLNHDRQGDRDSQEACLVFLPRLSTLIKGSSDLSIVCSAISCVDRIIEKHGRKDEGAVTVAAKTIVGEKCLGATNHRLRLLSLLCLATIIEILREAAIPIIPLSLSKALQYQKNSVEDKEVDVRLHNAVYSFICNVILYLPWMITGSYLDQFLTSSYESANADMGPQCATSRSEAFRLLAKHVDAKECLRALERTWISVMEEGPEAIKEYLELLSHTIEEHTKSVITKQSPVLSGILLQAWDLRRVQNCPRTDESYEPNEIDEVERAVNDSAIKMIYKLNDTTFRPMFAKFLEWANPVSKRNPRSSLYRQTAIYKFFYTFFDTLKSIVTSYATLLMDNVVDILNNVSIKDQDYVHLWIQVVNTLQKVFEHDQDDFFQTPTQFTIIANPLLFQLSWAPHLDPSILIPSIVALAVAADSAIHHKTMNTTILGFLRNDSAAIRLAAVQCQSSLTKRLGEEWLSMLPEMLPFISELQEDDDETVESETKGWIAKIEEILGESLDAMLQ